MVCGERRRVRERGEIGHGGPALPHSDRAGSHSSRQPRLQLQDEGRQAKARRGQAHVSPSKGEESRSAEGRSSGRKRDGVSAEVAEAVGAERDPAVVLGREREVGSFEEPAVHADTGAASDVQLLHVPCDAEQARSVPVREANGRLDEHPSSTQAVPSHWVAQEAPWHYWGGLPQKDTAADSGPVPVEEVDAAGTPAGPASGDFDLGGQAADPGSSGQSVAQVIASPAQAQAARSEPAAVASVKRRRKLKGRPALEQAAYTRKRMRREAKWVSRHSQLSSDERGFTQEEVGVIMAFYPGKPVNRHRSS